MACPIYVRSGDRRIGTEIYYPIPLHMQECFANLPDSSTALPHSETAAKETIALPIYPDLSDEQRAYVANMVLEVIDELKPGDLS